jgi:hypothetical protein
MKEKNKIVKNKHNTNHNISKLQQLESYNILNTIVPKYLKNYYPYTDMTPEKILFTQKKISLLVKKYDKYDKSGKYDKSKNKVKGGGNLPIVFYG